MTKLVSFVIVSIEIKHIFFKEWGLQLLSILGFRPSSSEKKKD